MTDKEKAQAYDEALERAKDGLTDKKFCETEDTIRSVVEYIFPELKESEDERIRKAIIHYILYKAHGVSEEQEHSWIAYLEKQRYDRMQPVYDNQESFESALDKAWKSYNDSGARTVDGCEDNYTECAYAKGFREGYLFGLEKQKDLDKMIVVSPEVWDKAISDAYENGRKDGEKQKEQKPAEHSAKGRRGRMGGIPEYVRRKAEAFKDKMEPPYDADDICTAYEAGALESAKPAELEQLAKLREMTHEIRDAYERGIEVGRVESKQEWSEEDKDAINGAIGILLDDNNPNFVFPEHSKLSVGEIVKRLKYLPERFVLQPKPEWGEEDEDMLWNIISIVGQSKSIQADEMLDWLKSLRPSWKPSEEQMSMLLAVINDPNNAGSESCYLTLKSIYEQLKKLL